MPNILTAAEGATILRTTNDDPAMLQLLPQVDAYIKRATGRDWSGDTPIDELAKLAASVLLVMTHENPGMTDDTPNPFGLGAALAQLEAMSSMVDFTGINSSGYCSLPSACIGDVVAGVREIMPTPGDAHTLFESVISMDGYIKQTSGSNLSQKTYRVRLTSPVSP